MTGTDATERERARFAARYEVVRDAFETEAGTLTLYRVGDLERLVDAAELHEGQDRFPYWAELWPSAIALARAIARDRWPLRGLPTLELGCGLGLAGLAAAAAGARVVATDYEPDAVRFARLNARANRLDAVRHVVMDWRRPAFRGAFSLVFAADVLYDAASLVPVADAMRTVLAPGGCALVAEPGRDVAAPFFEMLRDGGWSVEADGFESIDQGTARPSPVTIHRLVPPAG